MESVDLVGKDMQVWSVYLNGMDMDFTGKEMLVIPKIL